MAMYVSFSSAAPDFRCPVCLEETKSDLVIHKGPGGSLHPMHKVCAQECAQWGSSCPVCHRRIDPASLEKFPLLQRIGACLVRRFDNMALLTFSMEPPF